jgi:uncharacterized protein (DUF983 family)
LYIIIIFGENGDCGGGEMDTVAVQKTTTEKCIVCDEMKLVGIHLFSSFVCSDCEKDMVNTDTSDPKYKYYVDRLKSVTKPEILS